jgi:hypothetical protein
MPVRDSRYAELFAAPLQHPATLIFGLHDEFYEYGKCLADRYVDPVVLTHDGGHKFPADDGVLAAVAERILKL